MKNPTKTKVQWQCCFACWRAGVPPTWLVVCGCLVVQLGFGLYPVIVKKYAASGDTKANPVIFSFYRDVCCFPLLFLCALVAERKILIPRLKMLVVFFVLGLFGMFGNQLLFILGVYWAGPDIASALQPIIPVWTAIIALATCTEKLPSPLNLHTWAKLLGILLATGGAMVLTLTGVGTKTSDNQTLSNAIDQLGIAVSAHHVNLNAAGYCALFGNTFCMAIYVLLQKWFIFNNKQCRWRDYPVAVTAYSYFFGAIFMGLATIYFAASGHTSDFAIPQKSIIALVYAVFITSATCYLLITWSNMHLSATIVTAFWPSQVLVTVVASYLVLGEKLLPPQYGGAVMLIVALFLVLLANHMDERLAEGKAVLRLDACCHRADGDTADEHAPLIKSPNAFLDSSDESSSQHRYVN